MLPVPGVKSLSRPFLPICSGLYPKIQATPTYWFYRRHVLFLLFGFSLADGRKARPQLPDQTRRHATLTRYIIPGIWYALSAATCRTWPIPKHWESGVLDPDQSLVLKLVISWKPSG